MLDKSARANCNSKYMGEFYILWFMSDESSQKKERQRRVITTRRRDNIETFWTDKCAVEIVSHTAEEGDCASQKKTFVMAVSVGTTLTRLCTRYDFIAVSVAHPNGRHEI